MRFRNFVAVSTLLFVLVGPASALAGVTQVLIDETLGCDSPVTFVDGIPQSFTVIDNAGTGVVWEGFTGTARVKAETPVPFDTELVSNIFDLTAASWAGLSGFANYNDVSPGYNDTLAIDIFNGVSWDNLLLWDEDHYGFFEVDLAAYAEMADLQVRLVYSGRSWALSAYIYHLEITCNLPAITLAKTVGTVPGFCATSDEIVVTSGTAVTYCYEVTNTGNLAFTLSDLGDDQLGNLLTGSAMLLHPGDSYQHLETATIVSTTTNIATWTASGGPGGASASAVSNPVTVNIGFPLHCNSAAVDFSAAIPSDWTVEDDQGSGLVWTGTGASGYPTDCGEQNHTGGLGLAACASASSLPYSAFDTRLIAPAIDLSHWGAVSLNYLANFQQTAALFDVDVSLDGGTEWSNVLSWSDNHGATGSPPGEAVNIDLSALVGGQPDVLIRWRYYSPDPGVLDWYAEIDDVWLGCTTALLFADGFESADTSAWSATSP